MTTGAHGSASAQAYDATATANTLDYALGRRYKKAWMTGAVGVAPFAPSGPAPERAAPVQRSRGRPRKSPLPEAVVQQPTVSATPFDYPPTTAPSAERLPSSNSTSPQLANVVTDCSHSHGHRSVDITVLPSPTPSEDRQSVIVGPSDFASLQSPTACSPPQATAATNPTQHSLPPPKRHAVGGSAPAEKRVRGDVAQFSPASMPDVMSSSELAPFPGFPTSQWPGFLATSRNNPPPGRLDRAQNVPAHPTHVVPQSSAQPAPIAPLQRPASHLSDWYTMDVCMLDLESFDRKFPPTLRNCTDRMRLRVLKDAVRTHDWSYLTLHQYYCLMTSPQGPPLTLQQEPNFNVAYSIMRDVLDDNSRLSKPVVALFCNFPFPVEHLASRWPVRYQYAEREFATFVRYSPNVGALRRACQRRLVPPTPREFANCAIMSWTFQQLFFRFIVRFLWARYPHTPLKGQYEDRALHAFNRARSSFEQRRLMNGLGGREQAGSELQIWNNDFFHITSMFEASLQMQGEGYLLPSLAPPRLNQQQQRQSQQQLQQHHHHRTTSYPPGATTSDRRLPPPSTVYSRTAPQVHTSPQSRQGFTALLPRPGLPLPQQRVPNPARFGLHQAHLRSPIIQVANLTSPAYYFWQDFARKPQRLQNANVAIEKLSFTILSQEMRSIACAMPVAPGAPDTRLIDQDQKVIRLRCVKWPAGSTPKDEEWAVADTSWPPHSYFIMNDVPLQLRKKVHNGKDLPADITGLVRDGENVLEISIMTDSDDTTLRSYMVAVESLGIMTEESIRKRCEEKTIAADVVVSDIRRKLMPSSGDDDDIILMESTLTINLRDPFSASKICDTPVRGTACLHNECFDLSTFLETRPKKGDATTADQWRCPICKADARPSVLVTDGFLIQVRNELERKDLLHTRAITVSQDGSWKPKAEVRDPNDVSDRDTPEPAPTIAPATVRKQHIVHEIIDLDSD